MHQDIASPRVYVENTVLFPAAADFKLDATCTQKSSSEEILEQIVFDSHEQNELQRSDTYQTTFEETHIKLPLMIKKLTPQFSCCKKFQVLV